MAVSRRESGVSLPGAKILWIAARPILHTSDAACKLRESRNVVFQISRLEDEPC